MFPDSDFSLPIKITHPALIVLSGPLFAGKTTALINLAKSVSSKMLVFKSSLDDRYEKDLLATHDGFTFPSEPVSSVNEMRRFNLDNFDMVAIDEGHFFGEEIIEICYEFKSKNKTVIVAVVDKDHLGESYTDYNYVKLAGSRGLTCLDLENQADVLIKLTAKCVVCNDTASRFKRIIDGRVGPDTPYIWVGAKDIYKPLCKKHFSKVCQTKVLPKT